MYICDFILFVMKQADKTSGPLICTKELFLILDYLKSECYINTLKIILGNTDPQLDIRQRIKNHFLSGDIEKACATLEKEFPFFFCDHSELLSLIRSQIFIEYVRNKEPEKALLYGRTCIQNGEDIKCINDLFLLLAYKNLEACDLSKSLLNIQRRKIVFSEVDALIKGKLIRLILRKTVRRKELTSRAVHAAFTGSREREEGVAEVRRAFLQINPFSPIFLWCA